MLIVALFLAAKSPSIEKQIKILWYIHTTAYFSAAPSNELLTSATTWMNFQSIIVNG